jgi:hypothetical protein
MPPLPSSFYGTVKLGGANVPIGTIISARINGVEYASKAASLYGSDTVYFFDVPGDDPGTVGVIEGGVPGDTIIFYIGTAIADQTAPWQSGTNVALNLTATAVNAPPVISEGASVNINMSQNGSPTPFSLTLNATDADGDTLTWSISTQADHGTAVAGGTGPSMVIAYTPAFDYLGSDSFVVQVADGNGGTDTIIVNVTISAVEPTSFTIFLPLVLR